MIIDREFPNKTNSKRQSLTDYLAYSKDFRDSGPKMGAGLPRLDEPLNAEQQSEYEEWLRRSVPLLSEHGLLAPSETPTGTDTGVMSIHLPDLSRKDVLEALDAIDNGKSHNFADSTKYDVLYQGKRYPPKAVVGLAAERYVGRPLEPGDFSGGIGSRCFTVLHNAGFDMVLKPEAQQFAVITENDESAWKDETGRKYHFPARYREYLITGTDVIYYKGKQRKQEFTGLRLSAEPHYFAFARIGEVSADPDSNKGDLFAKIVGYSPLERPVLAKIGQSYLEPIPPNRTTNYWRDGVRRIDKATYNTIRELASSTNIILSEEYNDVFQGESASLESRLEGTRTERFVTVYERDASLRNAAITLHGTQCCICGFDFGQMYGELGKGYIHIHHVKPVSSLNEPTLVDPRADLAPVCANCHAIIHRRRDRTISIEEMKQIVSDSRLHG
jgi:predicted HNH restriction endonuclease